MKRLALSLATLSIFVSGCAAATAPHAPVTAAAAEAPARAEPAGAKESSIAEAGGAAAVEAPLTALVTDHAGARAVGDFVVFRFTGSFHDAPLTLEQRVIAREGTSIVVAMTLEDRGRKETLRVTMSDAPATRGEVLAVSRVQGARTVDATTADHDAMVAKVTLAADQNEAVLGTEEKVLDVAGTQLSCRTTSYSVKVGSQKATLRTIESDGFAWGDLGGEITARNGRLLYKAEVVGLGRGAAVERAETVAASAYDD